MTALLTACGRRCTHPWPQGATFSAFRLIVSRDGRRLCRIDPLSASSTVVGFVSQPNLRCAMYRARARATTHRRPVPDAHTRRPRVDGCQDAGRSSAMDMIRATGEGCIASVVQAPPGKCLGRSQEVATAGAFFASPKASCIAGPGRVGDGGLALADVKGASPVSSRSSFTSRKSHLSAPPHVRWSGGQVGTRAARPPYHSAWPHRRPSRPRCR